MVKAPPDVNSQSIQDENLQFIISQILSAANFEADLDDLFKFIHESIGKLMPADNFYIALYDRESNMISFPYYMDEFDKEAPPKRFGKGLTEFVITTGKLLVVTEKIHQELEEQGEIELIGTPSKIWLGVPLSIQDTVIGIFVLQDYHKKTTYGKREQEILEIISYPISRAIERKRVDQEREDMIQKLKDLNQSKDRLFSLISHDLRGPFNSLLGFSEILTTEFDTLTHEEIKEYLNVIYESSKNLYGMTNNLLQFSRFQMGRIEYIPVVISLNAVLNQALSMFKGNIIKKQLNIFSGIPESIHVKADEDMLNSIVQNLLSNAIKFTPRGGDIFITTRKVWKNNRHEIEVSIRDTGIGMDPDFLQKLFTIDISSTPGTEKEYGTGLGLVLTKEFIEKHGGSISVKSRLKEGSTFSFTIPAA